VFFIIHGNAYGLIFELSYICRLVHRQCLNHMSDSRLQEKDNVMTKVLFKESGDWS
jgi:hypothetical protein